MPEIRCQHCGCNKVTLEKKTFTCRNCGSSWIMQESDLLTDSPFEEYPNSSTGFGR